LPDDAAHVIVLSNYDSIAPLVGARVEEIARGVLH
jgi:hypothetical protein